MNLKITYSKVKHGRARVGKDGILKLTIPISMKNNKDFHNSLIKKGELLLKNHKIRSQNKIDFITDDYFYLFGEKINRSNIRGSLDNFLKEKMLEKSEILVDYYTKKLGVKYNKISTRRLKSKWGSCSSNKNISLNLYLAHLPTRFLEYVIIHEVCHLIEMNHSKNFWLLVEKLCPEYLKIRGEMKSIQIK